MAELKLIEGTGEVINDGLERLAKPELIAKVREALAKNAGLRHDLALAEEGMRELRASRAAYKAQLSRLAKVDPQAETIEGLLIYWRNLCHGPDSRVETPIDGKRADAVRKTIRRLVASDPDPELANTDKDARAEAVDAATDRAVARIRSAIEGAARFPFEGSYGNRFGEQVQGSKRKVDLIYVLRDEIKMEQFERLHEGDAKRIAYAHDLKHRLDESERLRLVLASLDPEYGEILARAIRWCRAQPQTPGCGK